MIRARTTASLATASLGSLSGGITVDTVVHWSARYARLADTLTLAPMSALGPYSVRAMGAITAYGTSLPGDHSVDRRRLTSLSRNCLLEGRLSHCRLVGLTRQRYPICDSSFVGTLIVVPRRTI